VKGIGVRQKLSQENEAIIRLLAKGIGVRQKVAKRMKQN